MLSNYFFSNMIKYYMYFETTSVQDNCDYLPTLFYAEAFPMRLAKITHIQWHHHTILLLFSCWVVSNSCDPPSMDTNFLITTLFSSTHFYFNFIFEFKHQLSYTLEYSWPPWWLSLTIVYFLPFSVSFI